MLSESTRLRLPNPDSPIKSSENQAVVASTCNWLPGLVNPTKTGVVDMHYRFLRAVSGASKNALSMVVRAFVTTLIIGSCVVLLMHVMGVPLPNIGDLWHGLGLSKLEKVFS